MGRRLLKNFSKKILIFICILAFILITPMFSQAEPKDFTNLIEDPADSSPLGERTPLILVHGKNGNNWPGCTDDVNNPYLYYWQTFRMFFYSWDNSGLKERYKLYSFWYNTDKINVDEIGQGLAEWIDERTGQAAGTQHKLEDKPFVIVAHSMGGLVSRAFMNKPLSVGNWSEQAGGERTLKLITLATPHHGTPGANGMVYVVPFCDGCFCEALRTEWRPLINLMAEPYWGFKTTNMVNRNDLLWDNFNNSMAGCDEKNGALPLSSTYDGKIIAYGGVLPSSDQSRPNSVVDFTLECLPLVSEAFNSYYCNAGNYHKALQCFSVALYEAMIAPTDYGENDGMVPISSSFFYGHIIDHHHLLTDFDHAEMKGDDLNPTTTKQKYNQLFGQLSKDLNSLAQYNINPTIAQTPMSGPPGTTFAQWGTGFTPNGTATLHFLKPDGTEYPTVSQQLDSIGHFDITYTAPSNKPLGKYSWWAIDDTTGIKSNVVTYEITAQSNYYISGTVTLKNSGLSGVTMKLSGSAITSTLTDASGNYILSGLSNGLYVINPEKSGYSFSPSQKSVNVNNANIGNINFSAIQTLNPTIAQTPMSGPPGTTFAQWGTGFTPNGTATLHFLKPDGTEYPTVSQQLDSIGHFDITYTAPSNKPLGKYSWWAIDETTGIKSNVVTYKITLNPTIAQTPMSGPPGTTFAQWGTGFTPNGTATLHFLKPDGTEYPTVSQQLDSIGHFDITYTAPSNKPLGKYSWWAIDDTTGIKSNVVTYEITAQSNYYISGTVTLKNSGLSGVTMKLSGSAITSTLTDASGNYILSGLSNGLYVINPEKSGYSFSPSQKSVNVNNANIGNINFSAIQTLNPTIAQTPMSGPPGTTFAQWGTGFTPNGTATLHFLKPDGTEYPTVSQQLDSIGHFDITYTAPSNKPLGKYSWWAIDETTGIKSNVVTYKITLNPTIAQTPMSGPPGTTFAQWGTGFTPNGTATLHFLKPDGTEYPTVSQQLDSIGHFDITYTAPSNKPLGKYSWWAIDDTTGIKSNVVTYKITK